MVPKIITMSKMTLTILGKTIASLLTTPETLTTFNVREKAFNLGHQ